MTQTQLQVRDLEVHYGSFLAARIPNLDVEPGKCVALVGESGSGKTTTLLTVLGLNDAPSARITGNVQLFGVDVLAGTQKDLRRIRGVTVAFIMQSPHGALNPTIRIGKYMRAVLLKHGIPKKDIPATIADALRAVRLDPELRHRYPHQLSGGQAQRFAIALAIALGADMIAADEPTSALDVTVQKEILNLLLELKEQRHMSILLVSHDLALVSHLAEEVLVMRNGEVLEQGRTVDVLNSPQHPYTHELISAVS